MTIVRQKVLPNTKLSDDVGIWEGSIVYEFLYLMLEAKAIVGLYGRVFGGSGNIH